MFTGIIESMARITQVVHEGDNVHITLQSDLTHELKIDQSVSHNGVCLTVVALEGDTYTVTAIRETLLKTNLGQWKEGDKVNLERAMMSGHRFDGHVVQGHVDQVGQCTHIEEAAGSWYFTFSYDQSLGNVTIEKGSITVNGVSLTVVNVQPNAFSVAIIPYTYEHTVFHQIQVGDQVNLEFDVIGKYVARLLELRGL